MTSKQFSLAGQNKLKCVLLKADSGAFSKYYDGIKEDCKIFREILKIEIEIIEDILWSGVCLTASVDPDSFLFWTLCWLIFYLYVLKVSSYPSSCTVHSSVCVSLNMSARMITGIFYLCISSIFFLFSLTLGASK